MIADTSVTLRSHEAGNCRPVYTPEEAKITYTAGRVLPADPDALALAGGALNRLLEGGPRGEAPPAFMGAEDAQEGFLMSGCSLFIDAAYSEEAATEALPSAPKPARRWLQVSSARARALLRTHVDVHPPPSHSVIPAPSLRTGFNGRGPLP